MRLSALSLLLLGFLLALCDHGYAKIGTPTAELTDETPTDCSSYLRGFIDTLVASAFSWNEEAQRRPEQRELQQAVPADAFTIVFISDLENKYRRHTVSRSQYVVSFLRDLGSKSIKWDAPYATSTIGRPRLVLHGGDISHTWGCENHDGCRDVGDEMSEVWDILYEADIPMLSSFGNHDWATAIDTGNGAMWNSIETPRSEDRDDIIKGNLFTTRTYDDNNRVTMDFVTNAYVKSSQVAGADMAYEIFRPGGKQPSSQVYGQSMYKVTFRGLQIASFNCAASWESYDNSEVYPAKEQFTRLKESLDKSKPTIFFSHYPIRHLRPTSVQEDVKDLIFDFPEGSHHFSGHEHVARTISYLDPSTDPPRSFSDYVAPYPHTWKNEEPGVYAILASPLQGVLQVKHIAIPGLPEGASCGNDCGRCHDGFSSDDRGTEVCGEAPCFGSGSRCQSLFGGCDRCCKGKAPCSWYRFGFCRCR